jgi:UDP-3-O-[3-hydroxymyristoyl] glucosamine N-acyltransferase
MISDAVGVDEKPLTDAGVRIGSRVGVTARVSVTGEASVGLSVAVTVGVRVRISVRFEVTARVGVAGKVPVVGIAVEPWDVEDRPVPNSRHVRPIANNITAHNEAPSNIAALIEGL